MKSLHNLFNPLYAMTNQELANKLGEYIKERRLLMRLTQQELADKVGVTRGQIVKIEKEGKTSAITLLAIARVFDVLNPFFEIFETPKLTLEEEFALEERKQKMINRKPKRIRKNG